jgi:hypothetical protein
MGFVEPPVVFESDSNPPLGSLIDHHLKHNGSHVWADIAPRAGHAAFSVTYRELGEAVHRFGRQLLATIGEPKLVNGVYTVIGILAPSDGLVYATVLLAIRRAGYVVRASSCAKNEKLDCGCCYSPLLSHPETHPMAL